MFSSVTAITSVLIDRSVMMNLCSADTQAKMQNLLTSQQSQQRNERVPDQVGLLAPLLVGNAKMLQAFGNDVNHILCGHSPERLGLLL